MSETRFAQIVDSCTKDADAKIDVVREMMRDGDLSDPRFCHEIALAAESAVQALKKIPQLNLYGIEYGLA